VTDLAPEPLSKGERLSKGRRRKAEEMAYALGVPLYLAADGTISQSGPGERIDPPKSARPTPHAHGLLAAARP
jgi:hypothetical protein